MFSSFSICQVFSSNPNYCPCWSYLEFLKLCSLDYVWKPSFVSVFSIWHDAYSFYVQFLFLAMFKYSSNTRLLSCTFPTFQDKSRFCFMLPSLFAVVCGYLTLNFPWTGSISFLPTTLLWCIFYCSRWFDIIHFSWIHQWANRFIINLVEQVHILKEYCVLFPPYSSFISSKDMKSFTSLDGV